MTTFICKRDVAANPVRTWTQDPARTEHFSLLQAAQSIARSAPDRLPGHCAPRNLARSFQPRMLLFLLSYCYARQVYKSADIERLVLTDALMRRCCGDESPTAQDIRRFRSEHREVLRYCLKSVLCCLAEHDLAAGLVSKVDEARIENDANRRLITAMFADSMETGGDRSTDEPAELSYLFANNSAARH